MNTMAMSTDKLLEDAVEAIGQVSVAGCPPGVGYLFDAPKVREIVYSAIMAKLLRHGLKVQGSCGHEAKLKIAERLAEVVMDCDALGWVLTPSEKTILVQLAQEFRAAK